MNTQTIYSNPALAIAASESPSANSHPEWLRIKEACHYSRLSKGLLYELMNAGHIRNVSLKKRGQTKGTRLISFDSLKSFLESRASGGENLPSEAL